MDRWYLLLPGVSYMLTGLAMLIWPPRSPRSWYGYHSHSSEHDQGSWEDANRFVAWGILMVGFISLNAGATCMLLPMRTIVQWSVVGGVTAAMSVAGVVATERWVQARGQEDEPAEGEQQA